MKKNKSNNVINQCWEVAEVNWELTDIDWEIPELDWVIPELDWDNSNSLESANSSQKEKTQKEISTNNLGYI